MLLSKQTTAMLILILSVLDMLLVSLGKKKEFANLTQRLRIFSGLSVAVLWFYSYSIREKGKALAIVMGVMYVIVVLLNIASILLTALENYEKSHPFDDRRLEKPYQQICKLHELDALPQDASETDKIMRLNKSLINERKEWNYQIYTLNEEICSDIKSLLNMVDNQVILYEDVALLFEQILPSYVDAYKEFKNISSDLPKNTIVVFEQRITKMLESTKKFKETIDYFKKNAEKERSQPFEDTLEQLNAIMEIAVPKESEQ